MIALGGAIGTGEAVPLQIGHALMKQGLFVGSGAALSTGGPVGACLHHHGHHGLFDDDCARRDG